MMSDLTEQPSGPEGSKRDELLSDLETVLGSPAGRRFVLGVLGLCGLYHPMFSGSDHAATDFRLGERNVGLRIIAMLERLGPATYPQLLLEAARAKQPEEPAYVSVDDAPHGDD
jgi:hypothetical protein